jgi:putative two-component system response regulator
LIRDRDVAVEEALFAAALVEPDGQVEYDGERRHCDGSWIPIHLSGGIARDPAGHPLYAMATIEDLRPSLEVEHDLSQTRQTLHSFIENVPAAAYMLDGEGRFVMLNLETERIIGVPRSDLIGRRRDEVPTLGAVAHTHRRTDQLVLATGRSHMCEEHLGDGPDERIFLSVKFPLHDADGTVVGIGGVSTDITELHRLRSEADRAWAETARRLAIAVEYRDEETGAHVERMAAYCELIATHLHDPELSPALMRAAAPLHDAGKIAIPDDILLKPDSLTAAERAVMEAHTTIGHQLLTGTGHSELDLAASIAYTHHERWDGTGYPRRLHGTDIPLEGRIAAIADVFDALTSDRVYRKALSVQDTITIMTDGSGTAFDPKLLALFVDHLEETAAIRNRWTDGHVQTSPYNRYISEIAYPST